jgi:hypothetical protein
MSIKEWYFRVHIRTTKQFQMKRTLEKKTCRLTKSVRIEGEIYNLKITVGDFNLLLNSPITLNK